MIPVPEKQTEDLVSQARDEYGELITKIVLFPEGLGLNAHLIGGEVVCYLPDGTAVSTWETPFRVKFFGHLAHWRYRARTALMTFIEKHE